MKDGQQIPPTDGTKRDERAVSRRFPIGWTYRLGAQLRDEISAAYRRYLMMSPLGQLRTVAVGLLLMCGTVLAALLVFPQYDRALVLSGRTELLAMRLDDPAFGGLQLGDAIIRPDPDTPAQHGRLQLDIAPGTKVSFVRSGRGNLRLTFEVDAAATAAGGCTPGLHQVGTVTLDQAEQPLCDAAVIVVPFAAGADPLVISLSGDLIVGEEVSQGAGPRPMLLEATASLLVKHSNLAFRWACRFETIATLCERFVANQVVLSPGNSVRAYRQETTTHEARAGKDPAGTGLGFIRIDPNESQSGMLFNLASAATAFQVIRMEGETFPVRESVFDVIEKSPLVRTLNAVLIALGLVWYFLRLFKNAEEWRGVLLILAALLGVAGPAQAQEALLRADDTGQALLRARGDRCYAVTPAHVMGSETSALVTAPGRERGEGDLLRRIPAAPEPIALLSLRGIPLALCPAYEGVVSLDALLRTRAAAALSLVRADGSIDRVPLMLTSVEVETLEVRTQTGVLEQGMSGGTVLVADQPVGLLVDVMDGGRTGRVARLDRIFERLAPHLSSALPVAVLQVPAGSVPYEVLRSNASPVAPGNKVTSLLGDGPGPWRVPAGRVELALKLSAAVSGITLDLTGLDDPPAAVEVLGGRSERGPWQSLTSMTLEPGDTVQVRRFPAVNLPYLLLRAIAPATRATLAINRISFLSK